METVIDRPPGIENVRLYKWGMLVLLLGVAAALWRYTGLQDYVTPDALKQISNYLESFEHPILVVIMAFVVASLVLFPVTAVVVISALTLPPAQAIVAGVLGVMTSSSVGYWIGYLLGPERMQRFFGDMFKRLQKAVKKNVFLSVFVVRHIPLGPFTLVNMMMGSMHLKFVSFLLANGVSLLPIIIGTALLGEGARSWLE